jgi:DnaJ-class molecular chaperone
VNANLILAVIAALAVWLGSLYVHPFGRCGKCGGAGTIRSGKRRVKVCPRCKGRRRVQRTGSRTVHRLARRVRHGRQAAARYQEDSDGDS